MPLVGGWEHVVGTYCVLCVCMYAMPFFANEWIIPCLQHAQPAQALIDGHEWNFPWAFCWFVCFSCRFLWWNGRTGLLWLVTRSSVVEYGRTSNYETEQQHCNIIPKVVLFVHMLFLFTCSYARHFRFHLGTHVQRKFYGSRGIHSCACWMIAEIVATGSCHDVYVQTTVCIIRKNKRIIFLVCVLANCTERRASTGGFRVAPGG